MTREQLNKIYSIYSQTYNLSTDSRTIQPGDVYLGLKGDNFDGNAFAEIAINMGASLAIIDDPTYYEDDGKYILVDDGLNTLQQLASYHRIQLNKPVLALTGTNGKTTTKELANVALSTKYNVLATAGNYNNHIGVPLTLLSATPNHDILIIEMGANKHGDIKELCDIALPDVGLITNIGKAHLEGFGDYNGVIATKSELYSFVKSKGGYIIYNDQDELLTKLIDRYTPSMEYSVFGVIALLGGYPRLSYRLDGLSYESNLIGGYNLMNIAAALTIGKLWNCDQEKILEAINNYVPTNNRSQRKTINERHYILDAYNANPTSMQLSVKGLADTSYSIKALVLGDMLELGEVANQEHLDILNLVNKYKWASVILVGPIFSQFKEDYSQFSFFESAIEIGSLEKYIPKEGQCLIKGSRGIKLESLLATLT